MKKLIILLMLTLLASIPMYAQKSFDMRYNEAVQYYTQHQYDNAIKVLEAAKKSPGVTKDQVSKATRFIKQCQASKQKMADLTLSKESVFFPGTGQSDSVYVTAGKGWEITSHPEWCAAWKDADIIYMKAQPNESKESRQGVIEVTMGKERTAYVLVTQDKRQNYSCPVRIHTVPGRAIIYVDSNPGMLTEDFTLGEGRHKVVIEKSGYVRKDTTLVVDSSNSAGMTCLVKLVPTFATLSVDMSAVKQANLLLRNAMSYCALSPKTTLDTVLERLPQWQVNINQSRDWSQWCLRRRQLLTLHLSPVVDYLEQGHDQNEARDAMLRGLYKKLSMDVIDNDPELQVFNGLIFEEKIALYRDKAKQFQELTKKALYCKLASRIPSLTIEASHSSEIGTLKRMIASGGRGTTIRHIIDQIPNLLPKLCPCMLMSPISVAQFIDLDQPKFDLVIFDEASQMPTAEAVGAIGRGKALIVVGDNKQMPPTSFFATQQVDDEDAEMDDLDSILDDCQALSLPGHYLAFHYRSKHESLIAFSNQEYYEGRLYTFPSADDRVSKVSLVKVEGVYDKGGKRSNRAEAEAVVAEIIRRLSDNELAKRSIGVVAFSVVQQNLIEDVLMEKLTGHPELEARAFQAEEPIFIKNLENVQGDERDVILFSVGYGPDKDGNVSMNFGPLNNRGGERRLNVAVSRARYEMIVFSTLRAEQIDLRRSKAAGVEGLQKFLKYAEGTTAPTLAYDGADVSVSSLATDIATSLTELGYETTTNVGRSKFKVDVAVVDPTNRERYFLGILIDSHSRADTKIARDRELTQPSVLQGLGWKVLRVWSIDWMQNRQRVLEAIVQALEVKDSEPIANSEPLYLKAPKIIEETVRSMPPASSLLASANQRADIDDIPDKTLDDALLRVVREQVALPLEDLLRSTTRQLGYPRRTKRIDAALMKRIGILIVGKRILRDGDNIKSL